MKKMFFLSILIFCINCHFNEKEKKEKAEQNFLLCYMIARSEQSKIISAVDLITLCTIQFSEAFDE